MRTTPLSNLPSDTEPRRVHVYRIVRRKRRISNLSRGDRFRTLATDREGVVTGFPHRGGPLVQLEGEPWPREVMPELLVEVAERVA